MVGKFFVKVKDNLTLCLLFYKQVKVRLVLHGALRPLTIVANEKHQKCGKFVPILVCHSRRLAVGQVANLLSDFLCTVNADPKVAKIN